MKLARIIIAAPDRWVELFWGEYYREARNCAISNQVNVLLNAQLQQVITDPFYLPFAAKSMDACMRWCILYHGVALRTVYCEKLTECLLVMVGWYLAVLTR